MADNTITHGAPGIANYDSETWANAVELRLQDTPAVATRSITITASGAALDLPLYSVVDGAGFAAYQAVVANKTALGVLTAPVVLADGDSATVDVMVAGHFDINALTFAATFDTPAKKLVAFDGLGSPINIILGETPFNSDGVLA